MKCTECGTKTQVTRTLALGDEILRVRKCPNCKWLYNTREQYTYEDHAIYHQIYEKQKQQGPT